MPANGDERDSSGFSGRGGLTQMKARPRYHRLHGDPRWGALLKKMGFEE
jgi:hypothetical protein